MERKGKEGRKEDGGRKGLERRITKGKEGHRSKTNKERLKRPSTENVEWTYRSTSRVELLAEASQPPLLWLFVS